ncbi:hypothetical protein F751_0199 [Auxenochlorella protothecoides]|uniref:Uncharacterized protein n=1 Tax=Auxenochlorella protothecoides TaxID=3075 RepID=A0A087S9F8_AUXPR|nr:hypothetical protein F751_0199 [Auxenochlorella protothecoides]KFM22362.1 hypothetical protein F751_0199 [Auxenochlorella protothecoides]
MNLFKWDISVDHPMEGVSQGFGQYRAAGSARKRGTPIARRAVRDIHHLSGSRRRPQSCPWLPFPLAKCCLRRRGGGRKPRKTPKSFAMSDCRTNVLAVVRVLISHPIM